MCINAESDPSGMDALGLLVLSMPESPIRTMLSGIHMRLTQGDTLHLMGAPSQGIVIISDALVEGEFHGEPDGPPPGIYPV